MDLLMNQTLLPPQHQGQEYGVRMGLPRTPESNQAFQQEVMGGVMPERGKPFLERFGNTPGGNAEMAAQLIGGPALGKLVGGILPRITRVSPGQYDVRVGDKFAGTASVAGDGTKPFMSAVQIEPQFQRQGIGSQIYGQVESDLGRPLVPSPLGLSTEAAAFWKKRLANLPQEQRAALIDESAGLGRGYGISDQHLASRLDQLRGGEAKGIRAFHGSPHKFDKFSMDRIGTGEGAQAYGHGLYFAENEGVAKSYRDMADSLVNGRRFDINNPVHKAAGMVDEFGSRQAALAHATTRAKDDPFYGDVLRALQSDKPLPGTQSSGHMYEVNIRANPEQFLDWDRRITEQSPQVQQGLKAILGDAQVGNRTGEQLYRTDLPYVTGTKRATVSEPMREAGIPGIKYLDQGSRTAGQGSSNYVVFDDSIIDILKRYGLMGGAAAGPLSQLMQTEE
jgi:GNAT superfamily N-acetyltransferase